MTPLLAREPRLDRSFERLYRRHAADVYRYAFGVLRNEADAEDVTQTTFLNAYRALERGEQPRVALNWLITIAHNVCRQRFRTASRRPQEVELDFDVADTLVDESSDGPTPEDIRRALGHLAFNQRAALVMRELEGRSYAEIAEVLGLTTAAVETLIFRARRALREQLEGALTCDEAERAISRQLDSQLSRAEKAQLRAHLRECSECATLARRQRAQRKALKAFGFVPLPSSLASLFGSATTLGLSLAAKTAAVVVVAGAVGAGGYDIHHAMQAPKVPVVEKQVPRAPVVAPVVHYAPPVVAVTHATHERGDRPKPLLAYDEQAQAQAQDGGIVVPQAMRHKGNDNGNGDGHGQKPQNQGRDEGASFSQDRHLHP